MLLSVDNNVVAAAGMQQTNGFRIANSAHAFRILSSGLYSDKSAAVIREIGCNAMDAHIAAGKPDVPFEVHLPSRLINKFYIRDFGNGMSHDDILELYTTYFSSSKSRSNDFTGAFGLGSKSPFAYTDNFTVTSFHDGVRTVYTAYVGTDGSPTISMVNQSPMEDGVPTGLMVAMAIKPADINEFLNKAQEIFQYFRVPPKMVNSSAIMPVKYEVEHETWALPVNKLRSAYVVMGNVRYDLPYAEYGDDNSQWVDQWRPELRFKIGELDVAANREQLEFTPRVRATVLQRIDEVFKTFSRDIYNEVMAMPVTTLAEIHKVRDWFGRNQSRGSFAYRALKAHGVDEDLAVKYDLIRRGRYDLPLPDSFKGTFTRYTPGTRRRKLDRATHDLADQYVSRILPERIQYANPAVIIPDGSKYLNDRLGHAFHGGTPYSSLYWVSDDPAVAAQFAKDVFDLPTIKQTDMQLPLSWVAPSQRPRAPRVKRKRELLATVIRFDASTGQCSSDEEDVLGFAASERYFIRSYTSWGNKKYNFNGRTYDSVNDFTTAYGRVLPFLNGAPTTVAILSAGGLNKFKLEADGWLPIYAALETILKSPVTRSLVNRKGSLSVGPAQPSGESYEYGSPLRWVASHAKGETLVWKTLEALLPASLMVSEAKRLASTSVVVPGVSLMPANYYNDLTSVIGLYNLADIQAPEPTDKSSRAYSIFQRSLSYTFPNDLAVADQEAAARVIAQMIEVDERKHVPNLTQLVA